MQRVMIVGGSGSGKSTLARFLGVRTGLPVYHMDHIHWTPGWVARATPERKAMALKIEESPKWIFEGGFSTTYDHRATRADCLIWLDLPVSLRLWRVTYRMLRYYGRQRPDMAEGCQEGLHSETAEFYRWIWRTRSSHRARLVRLIQDHPHLNVHQLTKTAQVTSFMDSFAVKP
ncbi:MAG: AAA family ATPase [Paracoccaceae bacterium]|nr:AAA family ATPase [Paracoccaceae bacterium]